MIRSFKGADAEILWDTGTSRRIPPSIRHAALKKLAILHWATNLSDLAVPGRDHLEALTGNRKGQQSIRNNNQYRLCFVRREPHAFEVEIVDDH